VCEDPRQYVGWKGQRWTTLDELRERHRAEMREEEPGLLGIGMEPSFAIGQRALLVPSAAGNVLWDCIPLVDDAVVAEVKARGGLRAVAVSHPHYYTGMVEWSRAFGGVPIHLHAADAEWVMRPDAAVAPWDGDELELAPGLTLLRLGGHFPGATVLHWRDGAGGRGALLSGDVVQVVPDRRWVSFMWSYPNLVPLPGREVRRIARALERWRFDRIHGAWWDRVVAEDGAGAVRRSAERYVRALEG
jgi:glyoxylase-like metal-dependent hydrolase (beta-lactamase superfamily II)